jgi:hypothetical protein
MPEFGASSVPTGTSVDNLANVPTGTLNQSQKCSKGNIASSLRQVFLWERFVVDVPMGTFKLAGSNMQIKCFDRNTCTKTK